MPFLSTCTANSRITIVILSLLTSSGNLLSKCRDGIGGVSSFPLPSPPDRSRQENHRSSSYRRREKQVNYQPPVVQTMISQEDSIDEDGTKAITNTTTTMKMDADESEKKNDEEDPARLVYQRREVAEAFVNIRDTIPLGKEQMDTMIRIIRYFQPTTTTKPPNLRWLDLGCGDGPLSQRLLEEFPTSLRAQKDARSELPKRLSSS